MCVRVRRYVTQWPALCEAAPDGVVPTALPEGDPDGLPEAAPVAAPEGLPDGVPEGLPDGVEAGGRGRGRGGAVGRVVAGGRDHEGLQRDVAGAAQLEDDTLHVAVLGGLGAALDDGGGVALAAQYHGAATATVTLPVPSAAFSTTLPLPPARVMPSRVCSLVPELKSVAETAEGPFLSFAPWLMTSAFWILISPLVTAALSGLIWRVCASLPAPHAASEAIENTTAVAARAPRRRLRLTAAATPWTNGRGGWALGTAEVKPL